MKSKSITVRFDDDLMGFVENLAKERQGGDISKTITHIIKTYSMQSRIKICGSCNKIMKRIGKRTVLFPKAPASVYSGYKWTCVNKKCNNEVVDGFSELLALEDSLMFDRYSSDADLIVKYKPKK